MHPLATRLALRRFERSARTWLAFAVLATASCRDDRRPVASGTLERDRVEVVAEQREEILQIAVREGQTVAAGDVLVTLDARRLELQVAAATARREQATASLADLVRGARPEEIASARERFREAESALIAARPELERVRALVAKRVESAAALDRADSTLRMAVARRDAARASLDELIAGATVEQLDLVRARVAEATAQLEEARLLCDRLRIVAPRPGVIDALPYHVGERPNAGTAVAILLTGDAPYARVYVPVELRPHLTPGATVSIVVAGIDGVFAGRVRTVSHEAAFTPHFALTERDRGRLSYLAEVDFVEPRATSLPTGLPVEVHATAGED